MASSDASRAAAWARASGAPVPGVGVGQQPARVADAARQRVGLAAPAGGAAPPPGADPRLARGDGADALGGRVGRAVVDHHHARRAGLGRPARQPSTLLPVAHRDQHGGRRRIGGGGAPGASARRAGVTGVAAGGARAVARRPGHAASAGEVARQQLSISPRWESGGRRLRTAAAVGRTSKTPPEPFETRRNAEPLFDFRRQTGARGW
jgi:hypothetical protein